jgi:hypothetical protein
MHAEMASKAGGFAFPLEGLPPVLFGSEERKTLSAYLKLGAFSRSDAPAPAVLSAGVAEPIRIEVSAEGVTITVLPSG